MTIITDFVETRTRTEKSVRKIRKPYCCCHGNNRRSTKPSVRQPIIARHIPITYFKMAAVQLGKVAEKVIIFVVWDRQIFGLLFILVSVKVFCCLFVPNWVRLPLFWVAISKQAEEMPLVSVLDTWHKRIGPIRRYLQELNFCRMKRSCDFIYWQN